VGVTTHSAVHTNGSGGAGANFTLTRGAVSDKDLMIASFMLNGTGTPSSVPSNWTQGGLKTSGLIGLFGWWWKVAGSSEASSYSWQFSAFQDGAFGLWIGTGADPVAPIKATSTLADAGANTGTPITAGSVSWTGATDVVSVILVGVQPVVTVTSPSGWTTTDGWTDSDGTDSGFHYGNLTTVAAATSLASKTLTVSGTTGADSQQIAVKVAAPTAVAVRAMPKALAR
jgi:hypothetical protein